MEFWIVFTVNFHIYRTFYPRYLEYRGLVIEDPRYQTQEKLFGPDLHFSRILYE